MRIGPFSYGLANLNKGTLIINGGQELSLDLEDAPAIQSVDPSTWHDATIPMDTLWSKYSVGAMYNLDQFFAIDEETVEKQTKTYACVVSAMYACECYYRKADIYSNLSDYPLLWSTAGTYKVSTASTSYGTVTYGATTISKAGPTVTSFCSSRGVPVSNRFVNSKPTFEAFEACAKAGNILIMHDGLWNGKYNSDGTKVRTGHGMVVEGTIRANNSSGSLLVLQVFDGWGTSVRYINYGFKNYMDFRGTFFSR